MSSTHQRTDADETCVDASPLARLPLACPLDGLPLRVSGASLRCPEGHDFNRARQGYANVLPVQFKSSRHPGDSASMVAARRRVLDACVFDTLNSHVCASVLATAATVVDSAPLLVDAGCGEGFHTARFAAELRRVHGASVFGVLGIDLSRPAILAAARRYRSLGWAVANNTRLPVLQGKAGIITSMFGFETWQPWAALQTAGQWVVVTDAGPRHLVELRELIYPVVKLHSPPNDDAALAAGYRRIDSLSEVHMSDMLGSDCLQDLLAMTPHAYRSGAEATDRLSEIPAMQVTLDTVTRIYQRC